MEELRKAQMERILRVTAITDGDLQKAITDLGIIIEEGKDEIVKGAPIGNRNAAGHGHGNIHAENREAQKEAQAARFDENQKKSR